MGNKRIQNLPTPTANGDAAPKIYVDAQRPTLYSCTLEKTSWTGDDVKTLTLSLDGVIAGNLNQLVIVTPSGESCEMYYSCGVRCGAQDAGSLVFICDTLPSEDLVVNIALWTTTYMS